MSPPLNSPLIIISPDCPPRRGGVADHTVELARGLSAGRDVTVLTSVSGAPGNGFRVSPTVSNWQSPKAVLQAISQLPVGAGILWQYVPQMYGRGGANPGLTAVMRALRRAGRIQCLIAHEIAAPLSWWPNRLAYAVAHRYQWRQILKHVDVIGISTEAWLEEWGRRVPGYQPKFFLAPSPSNIPVVAVRPDHVQEWRRKEGLGNATHVVGYFGTLHLSKRFGWILAAWVKSQAGGRRVGLVTMGDRPTQRTPDDLKHLFKPLGYLSASEVSVALQAVDVLALPFADGVAERRTTFMAGLSHGCAIITTIGPDTGHSLRQGKFFRGIEAHQDQEFTEQLLELLEDRALGHKLGQAARQAYEHCYSWPKLVNTMNEQFARVG